MKRHKEFDSYQTFINFSNKLFQGFLHHPNEESLFITPTDAHEVNLIMPSLNIGKPLFQIKFQQKILKLLKNEISTHLENIYLSFSSGVFPSILSYTSTQKRMEAVLLKL